MMKYWLSCVLAATLSISLPTAASAACLAEDVACWRHLSLQRGEQIDSLTREIGIQVQLLASKDAVISTQVQLLGELHTALDSARPALEAGTRKWHESPILWFAVGTGVGVILVVLSALVVNVAAAH